MTTNAFFRLNIVVSPRVIKINGLLVVQNPLYIYTYLLVNNRKIDMY